MSLSTPMAGGADEEIELGEDRRGGHLTHDHDRRVKVPLQHVRRHDVAMADGRDRVGGEVKGRRVHVPAAPDLGEQRPSVVRPSGLVDSRIVDCRQCEDTGAQVREEKERAQQPQHREPEALVSNGVARRRRHSAPHLDHVQEPQPLHRCGLIRRFLEEVHTLRDEGHEGKDIQQQEAPVVQLQQWVHVLGTMRWHLIHVLAFAGGERGDRLASIDGAEEVEEREDWLPMQRAELTQRTDRVENRGDQVASLHFKCHAPLLAGLAGHLQAKLQRGGNKAEHGQVAHPQSQSPP
mmetsp:Transcript_173392/g.550435  ORF Transcript_173392/g.550435 Transcript_173392/m.550435 type:complete len:293 (+) Transcript_173392:1491-2369(+)